MIQDARVLQDEFIPREVEHRDHEMNALSRALAPVTANEPAETAFLFGPSGAGKTCLARYALARLREAVIDLNYQYVNCWQDYTRFRALYRILEGIGSTADIHRQSTPTDALLERLATYDGPEFVVILDEVDQLHDDDLLYDLYRTVGISMILIANREEELFARLDNRLVSRLHAATRIRFEKYELNELVSILEDRVRWGLDEDVLSRKQLEWIADAAAGDARVAIGILRSAAREAEQDDVETIPDETVEAAIPRGRQEVKDKNIDQLTPHQKVLYEIIRENDGVAPNLLYAEYNERVAEPRAERTVRNHLTKLAHYNLIEKHGKGRGRTYSLV
ncbi:Cdc6/Cdc18 family protein [Halococcus sp. IIIV-5B]|uniref:Cdc6/Cdc18 family protein n=1 Tax=Halococcus sp. IIIV-5B TaxID=2321230 RepID=UPI000E70B3F3|nr:Cdc6/Cdc18 family protein [Halococcus sp. IIIV-5B]RJT07521.1 AAA family ATPase [Halococcus sp. IIIV-5B]